MNYAKSLGRATDRSVIKIIRECLEGLEGKERDKAMAELISMSHIHMPIEDFIQGIRE